jgi:hypothetical protein
MSLYINNYLASPKAMSRKKSLVRPDSITHGKGQCASAGSRAKQVTMDGLTWSEVHILFRAFVKFEVVCKIFSPRIAESMSRHEYLDIVILILPWADKARYNSLECVYEYLAYRYKALYIQSLGPGDQESSKSSPRRTETLHCRSNSHQLSSPWSSLLSVFKSVASFCMRF